MVREAIVEFGRHLRHLAESLTETPSSVAEPETNPAVLTGQDPIGQALLARLSGLAIKVDQQLQEQFINQQGGLFQTVMGNRRVKTD